jgi:hypothetical protein
MFGKICNLLLRSRLQLRAPPTLGRSLVRSNQPYPSAAVQHASPHVDGDGDVALVAPRHRSAVASGPCCRHRARLLLLLSHKNRPTRRHRRALAAATANEPPFLGWEAAAAVDPGAPGALGRLPPPTLAPLPPLRRRPQLRPSRSRSGLPGCQGLVRPPKFQQACWSPEFEVHRDSQTRE